MSKSIDEFFDRKLECLNRIESIYGGLEKESDVYTYELWLTDAPKMVYYSIIFGVFSSVNLRKKRNAGAIRVLRCGCRRFYMGCL